MKFDRYTIIARIFPAVLSSIPFFVLQFFFLNDRIGNFLEEILRVKWVSDVTISVALIYLLVQLSRLASKELYEKIIFFDGRNFSTTNYLLHLDNFYSSDFTEQIHKKIFNDFKISIPSLEQEKLDANESRKKIGEAVSLIRARVGGGDLVRQHNIEYGFIRNMIGGSVVAAIMSFINLIIFFWADFNQTAFIISAIVFIAYLVLIGSGERLINIFGTNYARVLIQEYMSK